MVAPVADAVLPGRLRALRQVQAVESCLSDVLRLGLEERTAQRICAALEGEPPRVELDPAGALLDPEGPVVVPGRAAPPYEVG